MGSFEFGAKLQAAPIFNVLLCTPAVNLIITVLIGQ